MAAKPRLYQVADTANGRHFIEDLPKEILLQIITFCSGDNPTIKEVALLFKSIGRVSKQLCQTCIIFCQRYPIDLGTNWQGRYSTIHFLCQNKVKLKSISLDKIWEDLTPSLFIYLLQECDLSSLESVYIKTAYSHRDKSPLVHAWDEALAAAIPREVYELEHFYRKNNTINISSLEESLKLQVLRNFCQIIRKKENKVLIRKLCITVEDWYNSAINKIVLDILKSGSSLESLKLHALDYLTESTLEKNELESIRSRFFASLEEIIAQLHISFLCLRSRDFNGELRIKSTSIQELEIYMKLCTIKEIKCPNLTKMKFGARYGKSFLSEFSSPILKTCTLVLDNLLREFPYVQSIILSKFIRMNKSLTHLTFEISNTNVMDPYNTPYNLIIESESLEHINATSTKRTLSITSLKCPNLKQFKIPFIWSTEDRHPIRSEPVFPQIYDKLQRWPIRAFLGLPQRDFLGREFDFQTINIPDDCWLKFR